MNTTFKEKPQKWLRWAVQHPKKFFIYAMLLLSVSFFGSIIQGVFFSSHTPFKIRPPVLYSKSNTSKDLMVNNEKEMGEIVNELKNLKLKRDQDGLKNEDSLRIDYLFNRYQKLKDGH